MIWANSAPVNFLCNVVSAVFGQLCQKQPLADVLENKCSEKFLKFHSKTSAVEFLFDKVAVLKVRNFVKKKLRNRFFTVNIAKFLRTPFFYRTPLVAVSAMYMLLFCAILAQADQRKLCRLFSFKIIAVRSGPILHK